MLRRGDIARDFLYRLKKCVSVKQLREIQAQMLLNSLYKPNFLIPKAIEVGDLSYASFLFSVTEEPNTHSFNFMIRGLTNSVMALSLYRRMKLVLKPDNFTYNFVLIACGNLLEVQIGRSVHSSCHKVGLQRDNHVNHSLISMYSKCGEIGDARKVFDEITEKDIVSWNSMISGYASHAGGGHAVDLFREMDVEPDERTLVSVLGACVSSGDLRTGRLVEEVAISKKIELSRFLGPKLISMYGKCGDLDSARRVFDRMSKKKDRVPWNAMIAVYSQNGRSCEAIKLFLEMEVSPDEVTLSTVLSACGSVGALELGKRIESSALETALRDNVYVATGLVDMYGKCGRIEEAVRVFEDMPVKNEATWNAMISAYAHHGHAQEALRVFEAMPVSIPPSDITFIGVLSACVHAGLVDQGRRYFHQMSSLFGLVPKIEHYTNVIDLLSRAGMLKEAWEVMESFPGKPDEIMVGAILGACQKRKDGVIGEKAMKMLMEMEETKNAGNYVISSKVYADMKMWDKCAEMKALMRDRGVVKTPGCSWIEINGEIMEFHAGNHCLREDSSSLFGLLVEEMKREMYFETMISDSKGVEAEKNSS